MRQSTSLPDSESFPCVAYIGIDWADRKHDICLYDPIIQQSESSTIGSQPEAVDAWIEGLRKRFPQGTIAICTEQKRGPLIYALCKYEFLVIHPVNPQTVAKYRQAFAPSRAKADPTDAQILVELLLKHIDKLKAWKPSTAKLRALQQLVENRRMLVAALIAQLQVLLPSIARFDARIEELFESHPDAELFAALPGAGPQLALRLLIAFGEDRERFGSAQDLLRYSGIAGLRP